MSVSTIGVADAAAPDKYLHTEQRTISGTAREDQYVLPGQSQNPTYSVSAINVSTATANSHILQIMGDGTNYSRLQRLYITPTADIPAAVTVGNFILARLSSAGTGGGSVAVRPYDTADSYGVAGMTLATSKGTEAGTLYDWRMVLPGTLANGGHDRIVWEALPGMKPIIFGPATSSGIAFKNVTAIASCTVDVVAEFTTTTYL